MHALRWHGRGDIRLDDVQEPQLRAHADTLVEVSLCGICGTDASEVRTGPELIRRDAHPLTGQVPPVTLGHELVGTVVAGGSPALGIEPGMRVTADACIRCGQCSACVRGKYHHCRYGGSIGLHLDGAFAPRAALPAYALVPVPDRVTDEQAALTEPFAVALHGLDRAQMRAGDDVVVLGFGPIGAAAALLARALGAQPWVVERQAGRRDLAARLGVAILDAGDDLPRRVHSVLDSRGADVVVESTGAADLVATAIECATRGGRVVLLGLPSAVSQLQARRLTLFERSLVGSLGYHHDLPRVLGLFDSGAIDPSALIGSTVPLTAAASALRSLAAYSRDDVKVLVNVAI